MEKRATADKNEPLKARYPELNLSDINPLKGANNIMVMGAAVNTNPVILALRCKTF